MSAERPNALRAAEQAVERLEAENARLRVALDIATRHNPKPTARVIERARAVLDGTTDEP